MLAESLNSKKKVEQYYATTKLIKLNYPVIFGIYCQRAIEQQTPSCV